MAMPAFRTHNVWQVRMYAARAAEPLKDVFTLQKLAYDDNDNVREATLVPLQRLAGADSQPAFIAALGRSDYQLVRTAAIGVKGRASDKYVLAALVDALERITAQKSETSRDTRLALIERLREAGRSQAPLFEKLLTDFDPRIAEEAAAALRGLGIEKAAAPRPLPREVRPTEKPPMRRCSPASSSTPAGSSTSTSTRPSRRWPTGAFAAGSRQVLRRPDVPSGRPELRRPGRQPRRQRVRRRRAVHARRAVGAPHAAARSACRPAATTPATRRSSSTSPTIASSTSSTP